MFFKIYIIIHPPSYWHIPTSWYRRRPDIHSMDLKARSTTWWRPGLGGSTTCRENCGKLRRRFSFCLILPSSTVCCWNIRHVCSFFGVDSWRIFPLVFNWDTVYNYIWYSTMYHTISLFHYTSFSAVSMVFIKQSRRSHQLPSKPPPLKRSAQDPALASAGFHPYEAWLKEVHPSTGQGII